MIPTPDVVNVLLVAKLLVIVPDATRFVNILMRFWLCIATLAASDIPVLLKLMIDVFNVFVSCIELDFNVSVFELNNIRSRLDHLTH